jgi:hypothetical protein
MLEMLGIAIEHFGTLPEYLNFSPGQWTKIIAWARIQSHAMDVCRNCSDEQDRRPRTCFYCGGTFSRSDRSPRIERSGGGAPGRHLDVEDAINRALGGRHLTRAHELEKERKKQADHASEEAALKEKQRQDAKDAFMRTLSRGD